MEREKKIPCEANALRAMLAISRIYRAKNMAKVLLTTGSVFGAALLTADEIETALHDASHEVIRPDPQSADALSDESVDYLVVCTSTTGSGDVPDDLLTLYTGLRTEYPRITHLQYLVVALGDSSYDHFCGGGVTMDEALADLGATQIKPPLKLDALEVTEPEEIAPDWVVNAIAEHQASG